MAKGNPFLGNITGSFGDITLSSYRGKTVIRRKCAPKNPRTPKQIYQRMFFATISKSRTALKPIIDHSFEQVQHGIDSLNYFTKRNIALMREGTVYDYAKQTWVNPNMNFVAPKATSFPANPLRISEGSLSPITGMPAFLQSEIEDVKYPEEFSFECCLPWIVTLPNDTKTYEDACSLVNSVEDVKPGDFVTAVFVSAKKQDLAKPYFPCFLHYVRYKMVFTHRISLDEDLYFYDLIPTNVDGKAFEVPTFINPNDSYIFDSQPNLVPLVDGENSKYASYIDFSNVFSVDLETTINGETINPDFEAPLKKGEDVIIAGTWIHSRPQDDKILTSNQDLILADPSGERIPFNLDMQTAFDLWTKQAKAIGEPKFLLEGGDV